jgi:hypothetical protein
MSKITLRGGRRVIHRSNRRHGLCLSIAGLKLTRGGHSGGINALAIQNALVTRWEGPLRNGKKH